VSPELQERLARIPQEPGVYLMRGKKSEVLYVGKATDLRSRVRSYFSGNDPRAFVAHLEDLLGEIETIICTSPKEALLLENTLIKRHRPRFNVMLRDDKNYLSLRIDEHHEWPRVDLVRRKKDDGATYFGPYHSAQSVRQTLTLLNRFFHLRTCRDSVLYNRVRPCLQYQIKRCPGPCVLPVDPAEYRDDVRRAKLFLAGRRDELVRDLEARMFRASEQLEFESAANLRDQIVAVRDTLDRQYVTDASLDDRDVIGLYREGETATIVVMQFRNGSLVDVVPHAVDDLLLPDDELVSSFISRWYGGGREVPDEVLVPMALENGTDLAAALSEGRKTLCRIETRVRGDKKKLLDLAETNARTWYAENHDEAARTRKVLENVKARLTLRQLPRTIECYDISNFQGKQVVASQVVFFDGKPLKARYRRYRIRTFAGQDDFAAMFEVLQRRVLRARDHQEALPDLIVIDGGKGQLNAAVEALRDLGVVEQDIVSLAKARVVDVDDATAGAIRSKERIFVPGRKNPYELKPNADETALFERIRDEAHRVAITFHRELRGKATLRSGLDDIDGIGRQRRADLLRHFGSLGRLRTATLSELERAPGISRALAARVFAALHPGEIDAPAVEEPALDVVDDAFDAMLEDLADDVPTD
jgi:excinuclease ABC subunit C